MDFTTEEKDYLVKVACQSIRRRLEGASALAPTQPLNQAVLKMAGCFVSLHAAPSHALRGCIGRIDSGMPLLQALQMSAWQVASDPRFATNPVTLSELSNLTVELSVLGMLRPAPKILEFEPGTDGIYLQAGGRAGVFLPQVAKDTGWNKEQLLEHLSTEKLGLPGDAWKHPTARLYTFPVTIIGPAPFYAETAAARN